MRSISGRILNRLLECIAIAKGSSETLPSEKQDRFGRAMVFELTIAAERAPSEYGIWFYEYMERTWYVDHFNSSHTIDSALSTWAWWRKFSVTTQDRFAWVPNDAEVDDLICIIHSVHYPPLQRAVALS